MAGVYWIAFLVTSKLHGSFSAKHVYWDGWFDQGQYVRSARAFAHGRLDAAEHWYPLLYSMLGAPFTLLTPRLPFAVPDFLLVLLAFAGFSRIAAAFRVTPWPACLIFIATTLIYPKIGKNWAEPWTTTLSAALIWLALAGAADMIGEGTRPKTPRSVAVLGMVLGLIPLARPGDAVVSLTIGLFLLKPLLIDDRDWKRLGFLILGGAAVVLPYAALHLAIYGPEPSDYMRLSAMFGLNLAWLTWKAYLILIEPHPWFPEGKGLLRACPWILLGMAGLGLAMATSARRWLAWCLAAVALGYSALILAYVDLLPSGLWRFNNVHYFKWLLPLFGLFAWLFLRDARRSPAWAGGLLVGLILVSSLRIEPVRVADGGPARLLVFAGRAPTFPDIYMAQAIIDDRKGRLRNFFEYHQVPDENGHVLAVALKRDFADDAQWQNQPLPEPGRWPSTPRSSYRPAPIAGPWPRQPIARFRPRLSVGIPCWLPGYRCPAGLDIGSPR